MNDEEIVKQTFDKVWKTVIERTKKKVSPVILTPKGYVLGGQPGAGKSGLIEKAKDLCFDNIIIISGDDFRKFHPDYKSFQEKYGKDSPKYTASFAGKMTEAILNKAVSEHYNVVIEGTFRNPATPIKTLSLMKENGYKTQVMIQTCTKELSWKSCQERYEKMKEVMPEEARWTDKEHHDLVCENLAKNIKTVCESGKADKTEIFFRDENGKNELIYSTDKGKPLDVKTLNNKIGISSPEKSISKNANGYEIER